MQYQSMTKSYFRGSALAIIIFDLTDRKSFQDLEKWIDMIRGSVIHDILIFIAGNKSDLTLE